MHSEGLFDTNHMIALESGFRMAGWRIRPHASELLAPRGISLNPFGTGGASHRVEPKAMRVLLALAAKPGQFISKDALIEEAWDGRPVTDDVLTHAIHALRSALSDDARNPRFIETRSNVGYRLLVAVTAERSGSQIDVFKSSLAVLGAAILVLALLVFTDKKGIAPIDPPSTIAVLPFVHLSDSDNEDYLSAAMTEALILNLAQLPGLRVISRTSVQSLIHHERSAASIAEQLGADLLVEGSLQTSDGQVRVVAQLIDPIIDGHLWSQHFDRPMDDILALQQEVARSIALQIGNVVVSNEPILQQSLPTTAMNSYFQARYLFAQEEISSVESALKLFRDLVERYPEYAPAHLGVAQSLLHLFKANMRELDSLDQALVAAMRYESIAGSSSESHRCIGQLLLFSAWDFQAAQWHYQSAIALNPSDTVARRRYAWLLVAQQDYQQAADEIHQIRLLDPMYYDNAEMAALLLYSGQINAAVAEFERLDQSTLVDYIELRMMGMAYLAAGRDDEAHHTFVRMVEYLSKPDSTQVKILNEMDAAQLYQHIIDIKPFNSPIASAGFYNLMGDSAAALHELEQAVARRDAYVLYLGALPEFASLHDDPRFLSMLAEIGVKPERTDHLRETRLNSAILRNPQTALHEN